MKFLIFLSKYFLEEASFIFIYLLCKYISIKSFFQTILIKLNLLIKKIHYWILIVIFKMEYKNYEFNRQTI